MPIFEFACQDCHTDFELLVRSSTALACPHCQSTALEKKLSVFSTAQGGAGASAGPEACMSAMASGGCGACGAAHAGACGLH
jgi:putative FmdB family regulatory protein